MIFNNLSLKLFIKKEKWILVSKLVKFNKYVLTKISKVTIKLLVLNNKDEGYIYPG